VKDTLADPRFREVFLAAFALGFDEGLGVEQGDTRSPPEAVWEAYRQGAMQYDGYEVPTGYRIAGEGDIWVFARPDGTQSWAKFGNEKTAIINAQADAKGNRR
jgi:hypothetical protein